MKRILIVYNPRSSKCLRIRKEVIEPLQKIGGYQVGKFEIKSAPTDKNIMALERVLLDDDLVVAAGGDGTATVAMNAIMNSGKDATLGVLGYGNFNDFARMLKEKDCVQLISDYESGAVCRLFPIEAVLDGKHWRYAACYFTVGMFAESTEIFDKPNTRGKLKKGKKGLFFSILTLASWYFRNRKKVFLPVDIQFDDVPMNKMKIGKSGRVNNILAKPRKRVSDVMFVNGKTVAKVMRGGDYCLGPEKFLVCVGRSRCFLRLCGFMIQSIFLRLPGKIKNNAKIDFSGPEEFEIQAEGEYARVRAKELVVKKDNNGLEVVYRLEN